MSKERCKATVLGEGDWRHRHGRRVYAVGGDQCRRFAVHDGYCTQHHPASVAERDAKTDHASQAHGAKILAQIVQKNALNDFLEAFREFYLTCQEKGTSLDKVIIAWEKYDE